MSDTTRQEAILLEGAQIMERHPRILSLIDAEASIPDLAPVFETRPTLDVDAEWAAMNANALSTNTTTEGVHTYYYSPVGGFHVT